jgi:hypothetical protein
MGGHAENVLEWLAVQAMATSHNLWNFEFGTSFEL